MDSDDTETMTDEKKLSVTLIEAAEYLGKLGRNMNIRSTSLIDNRLKDVELGNVNSLKKASSKILKICALSRKSLETVETGVHKLLDEFSRLSHKNTYVTVEYENNNLKIPANISLKHYKSCRVLAHSWPLSMLEEYPIYYDCIEHTRRKKVVSKENKDCITESIPECEPLVDVSSVCRTEEISKEKCQDFIEESNCVEDVNTQSKSDSKDRVSREKSNELVTLNRKDGKPNDDTSVCSTESGSTIKLDEDAKSKTESGESGLRPMFQIRCVDISKLVQPDKLGLVKCSNNESKPKVFKSVDKKHKTVDDILCSFKPKPFSINVSRLGPIDAYFLKSNKLSQVWKYKGHCLAKLPSKVDKKLVKDLLLCDSSDSNEEEEKPQKRIRRLSSSPSLSCDEGLMPVLGNDGEKNLPDTTQKVKGTLESSQTYLNSNSGAVVTESSNNNASQNLHESEKLQNDGLLEKIDTSKKYSSVQVGSIKCDSDIEQSCDKNSENNILSEKYDTPNVENEQLTEKTCSEETTEKLCTNNEKSEKVVEKESCDINTEKEVNGREGSVGTISDKKSQKPAEEDKIAEKKIESSINADIIGMNPSELSNQENEILNNNKEASIASKNEKTKRSLLNDSSSDECKSPPKKSKATTDKPNKNISKVIAKKKLNKEMLKRKLLASSSDEEDYTAKELEKLKKKRLRHETETITDDLKEKEGPPDHELDEMGPNTRSTRSTKSKDGDSAITGKSSTKEEEPKNKKVVKFLEDEVLLGSEESASDKEDEDADVEDLPDISGMNGDKKSEDLAKEDLLQDSEDDMSSAEAKSENSEKNNGITKKKSEANKESTKSSRRKVPRVTSDESDGENNAKSDSTKPRSKKDNNDESDDSEKHFKPSKRKAQPKVSSDESESTSNDGKRKHKRIKKVADDDSESNTDSEREEGKKGGGGRKNIRKVIGKDRLEAATKKAARDERERVARIAERQKLYNSSLFDESGKPDEIIIDKVVLDYDPETKEPLIQVDPGLVKKLKPHQANGIKFMWDACFESVKQIKKSRGSGCILAHCMGLGKTLQVVSLTHTLLAHSELTGVQRVLVVCPLSTVLNWVNELRMWTAFAENQVDLNIYELSKHKQNFERSYQLKDWYENGGICVLGYEMFRNLSADNIKKFRKKLLKTFQESLVDPGPDLIVCDEGHLLKNEKTSLSQSMNRIRTRRRIVLTGTPLQNNLKEYYCMVQFVKPNLLGKYNEYLNRFVNPITNGQYVDSTDHDIKVMKRRSHVLHKMLDAAVQRRDYAVLAPFLPPKNEYVVFVTLTELQIELYQYYLDNYSRRQHPDRKSSGFLFPDFQSLQRIWTHPFVLKANSERYEIMQQKKRDREEEEEEDTEGSLVDFLDDDDTSEESSTEVSSDDMSDLSDSSHKKKSKKKKEDKKDQKKEKAKRSTRTNPVSDDDVKEVPVELEKSENPTEWWIKLVSEDQLEDMRHSHKLLLLFDVLRQCEAIGDKVLVFSQSLYSLDLIEHFLNKVDEATQEGRSDPMLAGHMGSWSQGLDYFRLDGSTSCENRSIWCKSFNREDNPRARLFLISTRAGGLGINLVAANRVIIFDVSWNPSHDVQSIFRVYRFGQKKPCYIYRFLAMGTMEEKIYERQVTKQAISKRVIDEQQIDRHYAETDLQELYQFTPTPAEPRPIPNVPKDRLFAEMLKENEKCIYKYHEHDSLLENKEEETLSEEERKAAWEDFENEKNRPPPVPAQFGMFNGPAVAAQQQMAMSALASLIRKDYPTLSEQQLANMLPSLLYRADPSMMQKMNALMMGGYGKYQAPQQPHMNPAMMLNPGNTSKPALHYQADAAWQMQQLQMLRQQQQQQQNAMGPGVKYYAGGLGSRDPMSIALQQQRQRDLLRGHESRAAPSSSGEVVDLGDSDW